MAVAHDGKYWTLSMDAIPQAYAHRVWPSRTTKITDAVPWTRLRIADVVHCITIRLLILAVFITMRLRHSP